MGTLQHQELKNKYVWLCYYHQIAGFESFNLLATFNFYVVPFWYYVIYPGVLNRDFEILSSSYFVKQRINLGFEVWEPHLMIELSLNPALYLMRKSLMAEGKT